MSVYDTSPQAIAAYIANQQRCHNWAGNTASHANEFKLPFGTRSDISSASSKLRLGPDEEDDLEGSLGVPDWERAEMHQLLNAPGYSSRPARETERERGRHDHHQPTERPSTSTLRQHSHGRHRDQHQHHHHSRSREVVEQLPPPPPPLKEKKSRSHSRHASSSSRRSRKTSNQTMIYTQPQPGYAYQPVIPPPPPEPKRGFFASIFHRRRSISLPRQPAPPFLQQPPLQTRLSRSASFHRNRGEVEVHHHSSRSKSMERRAVPPLQPQPQPSAGYWPSRSSPTAPVAHYHNSTPSPGSDSSAPLHPVYTSGAHGQYMYAQPKHQMGYFPPQPNMVPQRTVPAMSGHRAPIPSQWHQPPPTLQQMYARPQYSPYS